MSEKTMFPREDHTEMLFQKILNDPWACDRLMETFNENLVYNDEFEHGNPLPEYKHISHDKNYIHFHEIYNDMPDKKDIYYAQAYRYSHTYDSEHMTPTQQVIVKHDGILLIRELPDTVKLKETEAEAYSAVWDLMIQIEKELPMAYVFYGQDSLVENDKRYDEIGIFLRSSHFLKNLEKHVQKAEAIIYGR